MKQVSSKNTVKVINLVTKKPDIDAADVGNPQITKNYANKDITIFPFLQLFTFFPFPAV